jgi:hypothetical protein
LVVRKRSVAVLYADSAELDADAINLEALETLVRVAGMAVELLVARAVPAVEPAAVQPAPELAPSEVASVGSAPVSEPSYTSYTPVAEYDEISPVVEESAPVAEIADVWEADRSAQVEVQPEPQYFEPTQQAPAPEAPAPVEEVQAEVAPPEAPVQPVEVTADLVPPAAETPAPATTPRRRYGADVELPVAVASEEERRLHNDARRFARLLVSEIKLYNEQKVSEGRSQGDLYPRLREYIDRSREMYDKRVKPEVAQRYDYFHNELVATLAEGDENKLGSAYPGATVSA